MEARVANRVFFGALVVSGLLSTGCGYQVPMLAGFAGEDPRAAAQGDEKKQEDEAEEEEGTGAEESGPSDPVRDEVPSDDPIPEKRRPDEVDTYEAVPLGGSVDPDEDERRPRSVLDAELDDRDPDDAPGDEVDLVDPMELD